MQELGPESGSPQPRKGWYGSVSVASALPDGRQREFLGIPGPTSLSEAAANKKLSQTRQKERTDTRGCPLASPCVPQHTLIHRERLKINTSSKTRIHHWAVENYNAIPLHTPIRMAKNTTSGKHSHTLMERMQNDKAFLEMVWQSIIKLNIHLPFESSCSHLEEVTISALKQSCK